MAQLTGLFGIRIVHGAVDAGFGVVIRIGIVILGAYRTHILSYKPRSIHAPHPRRIASMAESALDGSALGRVRGVTPPRFYRNS